MDDGFREGSGGKKQGTMEDSTGETRCLNDPELHGSFGATLPLTLARVLRSDIIG